MDVSGMEVEWIHPEELGEMFVLSFLTLAARAYTHPPKPLVCRNLFLILVFSQFLHFFLCSLKSLAKFPWSSAIN